MRRLLVATVALVGLLVVLLAADRRSRVDAVIASSRCKRLLESAMESAACDSSPNCLSAGQLCFSRGQCMGAGLGTGACSDCSWTNMDYGASTDCSVSTSYSPPATRAEQVEQLTRQLALPVLIAPAGRYLPQTMESFDQACEMEVKRVGSSGAQDFTAPNILLFLDEPNTSYSGLRFGVGSPLLGYIPDISNPAQINIANAPTYNFVAVPLPLAWLPGTTVDYHTVIEMADALVGDVFLNAQFVFRQSDTAQYMINEAVAESTNLYERYWIPQGEGANPWPGAYRPFMPQAAFFRPIRSDNQTRMLAALAASLPQNKTGAGVFFKMQPGFQPSFLKSAKTFGVPGTNQHGVGSLIFSPSAPVLSKYLLPGIFRMKLTTQSSMWYVPMTSWRVNTWVAGESPLLIYRALEASPPGYGSHSSQVYHKTNTLTPVAPADLVDNASFTFQDVEALFDYANKPVAVDTCGNVATILTLQNGSIRVIYMRDARTHEYLASATRRAMFANLYLRDGLGNASAMTVKCTSFGDDFILYAPRNLTIWAFGRNTHNRFSHWDYGRTNNSFEGEEIMYVQRVPGTGDPVLDAKGNFKKPWLDFEGSEINDTIAEIKFSEAFMMVRTTGERLYFAGNSAYGPSRYACCKLENAQFLTRVISMSVNWRILEIHLGLGFSVLVVRTVSAPKQFLIGCGQETTITPPFGLNEPRPVELLLKEIRTSEPKKVCTGLYHACVMAQNGKITCWGYMRTTPNYRICGGNAGPAYNTETQACATGEDMTCGYSHVAIKRYEGVNRYDGTDLQSWSICGSADKGQIGAGFQLSSDEPDANSRPLFAAPQRIFQARTADAAGEANLVPPVMETYALIAHRDSTIAFTQPRRHASIDHMILNWVSNAGRLPPNGWHVFHPSFGDAGPHWMDFTALPGVPLIVVANQSAADSPWQYMPTDSATVFPSARWDPPAPTSSTTTTTTTVTSTTAVNDTTTTAAAAPGPTTTTMMAPPPPNASWTWWAPRSFSHPSNPHVYFKNWTRFMRNITTAAQYGPSPLFTEVIITMFVPHLVLLTSKGEVLRLGIDALPCNGQAAVLGVNSTSADWHRVTAWCDASNMNRGLWKTAAAPAGGYSDPLASGDLTWVALSLRIRVSTYNRVLRSVDGRTTLLNGTDMFFRSQPSIAYFFNQYNPLRWQSPPCTTLASPLDCGGAVFFEAYIQRQIPQAVTRTTLFSFPVGGVRLSVLNISSNFQHAVEMRPIDFGTRFDQPAGGVPGLRGTSADWLGLLNVCFFMKVGVRYYWIMLKNDNRYLICEMGATMAPGATKPAGLPVYGTDPNQGWEFPQRGVLRIRNLDRFYASNYDPIYEINDLYFAVNCSGGLLTQIGVNGTLEWTNHSAFIMFVNETVDELFASDPYWWYKDTYNTRANESAALTARMFGPYGCAGGLFVPVQPMVEATQFHTFVQTELPMHAEDEIVIAITSPQFSALHVRYFFVVGKAGPRVERITDTTTWNKARIRSGRTDATVCNRIPLRTYEGYWNSFSLIHNITTGLTELWWNSKLACSPGTWFGFGAGQAFTVSGIYVGVRNRDRPFYAVARFRELVLCDARTPGYKMWGCTAGLYPYVERGVTHSESTSLTHSQIPSETKSLITRDTMTISDSGTFSLSVSPNISESSTYSLSVSDSKPSLSESRSVQESQSNTTSFSSSESHSHIHIHNLHLLEFNQDLVTSNLIRRTGLLLRFYLEGDLWNPYSDWDKKPAGYLYFQTDLGEIDNPNALGYSYKVEGVLKARIRADNWSILEVQIGPSGNYNSGRDEVVVFRPQPSGCASHILPPNNITIRIPGAGFFVSTSDRIVEFLAAGAVLLNLAVIGQPSLVLRFASNLVLTNFQCYNNENFPTTFLFNPITVRIDGSRNIGMAVTNLCIILGIFALWWIAMAIFKGFHRRGWHKTFGYFGWPSLPILVSLIFTPGLIFGAWRTAFEADSAKYYFIPLGVMILIFIPLIYLYSKIMDDANFLARWEQRDADVLEVRRKKYPIWSQFQLPGAWVALDTHGEFVRQLRWFFWECTEERRYFILYELCVLLMESFICSITNTKYAFCVIQMLVVALMRFALFVTSLRLKPRNATAHHYIVTVIYAGQAAMAIIVAAYAAQELTNTMRSFVGFMLLGSSFTICVLAILSLIGASHERLLELLFFRVLKRESDMTERARPYKERTVDDIILEADNDDDNEGGGGDGDDEGDKKKSSGGGSSDENDIMRKANKVLGINDGTLVIDAGGGGGATATTMMAEHAGNDTELRDISVIGQPSAAAAAAAMSPASGWANPLLMEDEDDEEVAARRRAAAAAEAQRKADAEARRKDSRNVWKLIAMEEATDAPTKSFTETDDLL